MPNLIDATERRLNLVIALLGTRRGHSRAYIRQHLNGYDPEAATAAAEASAASAFERMFERDKETLRELGIPLTTTVNPDAPLEEQVLYRIDPADYRVPEIRLDPAAMNLLAVAANVWAEASFGAAAQSALRKLASRSGTGWYDDDATITSRIRTQEPAFEPLWDALRGSHPVTFAYQGAGAAAARARTVQPWGLGQKYGHWYLAGLDLDKGQPRSYRLSRIRSAVTVVRKTVLTRPATFRIAEVLDGLGQQEPHEALVRVPEGAAHTLRRLPDTRIDAHDDGTELLAIRYREPELLADDVAALGAQASVVAPATLRVAVLQRLRGAATPGPAVEVTDFGAALRPPTGRRPDTRDRLVRLLSMVPFLVANPGIPEEELAQEFALTPAQLSRDLATLSLSGLPGYLHGDLMDVSFDSGQVFIRDAETLASPLRLTQEEACALLVGLQAVTALPGTQQAQALAEARTALHRVAGSGVWLADAVAVQVLEGPLLGTLTVLQSMIGARDAAAITYLVRGRDELSERVIEPRRLFSIDAHWYVRAWCRRAQALRSFRLDAITALAPAGPQLHQPEPEPAGAGIGYTPGRDDTWVWLVVEATTARRLAPAYGATLHPVRGLPDHLGVRLQVGQVDSLPALMARLGGVAHVVAPAPVRAATTQWLAAALESALAATALAATAQDAPVQDAPVARHAGEGASPAPGDDAPGLHTPPTPSQDG